MTKEEKRECDSKYCQDHKEEREKTTKRWLDEHPERAKELHRKHNNKRQRGLGFHPLNKWFEGAEAHHINFNDVVYIPREVHRSVSHNVWTGRNMGLINNLAYQFLLGNYIIYK